MQTVCCSALEPGMPCRVHPAEVVRTAGCSHQLANLALRPVEGAEAGQPAGDGGHGLAHLANDDLAIVLLHLHKLFIIKIGRAHV